jgi:hypothetical protein
MMLPQKVAEHPHPSFPRKRESRNFRRLQADWIPAYAGMTTFCECINVSRVGIQKIRYHDLLSEGRSTVAPRTDSRQPAAKASQHFLSGEQCSSFLSTSYGLAGKVLILAPGSLDTISPSSEPHPQGEWFRGRTTRIKF